ncbi:MAG TPA: glycosyltransferase family 4 protein [Bryobacteraceae bacterium]|jgi:glycosyltransferase involved in cell wall biosynthesis|nr:glycosyltransferase family 4 protein [Bryobacteraceae bacterium]
MPEREVNAKSLRVLVLANVIAPYQKPVFDRLAKRFGEMRILLSTPMESNRPWKLEWAGLDVRVQKTITFHRRWRHPKGFTEPLFVHMPVDTIPQLARFRADVVISWEMGMRTIQAALYRRFSRAKLMVWAEFAESTEYGRGRLRQAVRRVLHRGVDGFLVTGESGARYLESIGVARRKLHKIVYTTGVERFAEAVRGPAENGERRLLYVGQLIERKGLMPFLKIAAEWAERHPEERVSLTLAGDGPLRAPLESYSAPSNLRRVFLGNSDYERLPEIYAKADVFVFPTLADTWGVVVNEALASGVPVLGSRYAQAVSELVRDGANGWTFRPDHQEEMAAALERALATDCDALAAMQVCARQTALRLTPDYAADCIERGILACVAQAGASRP